MDTPIKNFCRSSPVLLISFILVDLKFEEIVRWAHIWTRVSFFPVLHNLYASTICSDIVTDISRVEGRAMLVLVSLDIYSAAVSAL